MNTVILTQDHQGYSAGTEFVGPSDIPPSEVKDSEGNIIATHTFLSKGYFLKGADPHAAVCFYESYINDNPNLFKQVNQ